MGVHKKCQGLLDIDIDYKCDICSYMTNKVRAGKKCDALEDYQKCIYCLQSGAAMKTVEKYEKRNKLLSIMMK